MKNKILNQANNKGFTLTELLIVVAVIGILAAISIPTYLGVQKRGARTEAISNLQNIRLLLEQYYAENGCYYKTGATPVCTNATRTGVSQLQQNASSQPYLPGFKPIDITTDPTEARLHYAYSITTSTTAGQGAASCFTATATGKAGTNVSGDTGASAFTLTCNNARTGPQTW